MINYELSILIAIFSFVYSVILTDVEMILNPAYNWFDNLTTNKETGKKHWIFKMLMHCEKCVCGQVSFWLYIYSKQNVYFIKPFESVLKHIFFVSFSIIIVLILSELYKILKQITNTNGNNN